MPRTTPATLTIHCPAMAIVRVARRLRRTAAEPMAVAIDFGNGIVGELTATIPETDVHEIGGPLPTHWLVDACDGWDAAGHFVVELPQQATTFELATAEDGEPHMVAQPITAQATFWRGQEIWRGPVTFGRCLIDWPTHHGGPMTARPLVATGTLNRAA